MSRVLVVIASSALLGACSSPRAAETSPVAHRAEIVQAAEPAPPQPPSKSEPPAASAPTPDWVANTAITSNGDAYVVHVAPAPKAIVDNETFALEVWIADAAHPNELARDVSLAVAAAMPEHGHGMNRVPKITRVEDGHFRVEGMLFHMTGHWELYFDVTRGAVTERAQCDVMLE